MNILYDVQGHMPNLSSGGPFRVVAMLLSELQRGGGARDVRPYLIAKPGIFDESGFANLLQPSNGVANSSSKMHALVRRLRRSLGSVTMKPFRLELQLYLSDRKVRSHWEDWAGRTRPCLIHCHLNLGAYMYLKNRNRNLHRLVMTYHSKGSVVSDYSGSWGVRSGSSLAERMTRQELYEIAHADVITYPSRAAFGLMAADYPKAFENIDVRIIHNGIDIAAIDAALQSGKAENLTRQRTTLRIVNIAQHVRQKRVDVLLRAVEVLSHSYDIELTSIGTGILLNEHRELAHRLGLGDRVRFLAHMPNAEVLRIMQASDLFVMPSENVVFDLITLEAMAVGVPIIVSATGGNLECLEHMTDAVLTEPGDVQSVVQAIRLLVEDRALAERLARSARTRVEREFSVAAMTSKYVALYREIYPST
jgi:glycosyltransferase involved in cell wall biosynthesis